MSNRFFARAMIASILGLVGMSLGCDKSPSGPTPPPALTVPAQPVTPAGYALYGVTLFGVISEVTSTGQTPIAGVRIYCDACGEFGHTDALTDANGYYSFTGDLAHGGGIWLFPGHATPLLVGKEGYQDPPGLPPVSPPSPSGPGWRDVTVSGDTRFDMQLVRR